MKRKRIGILMTLVLFAAGLTGCKSGGTQKGPALQDQPISEEERELVQKEQARLDDVEQQRTGNASAHSCRKAKEVYAYSNTKVVDTDGCSAEQLKLEQDAELKQAHDKVIAERIRAIGEMREKLEHNMKPAKGHSAADE